MTASAMRLKGMFRVHLVEPDGRVIGDSGWRENLITTDGFLNYVVKALGAIAGSSQIGFMGIGTGTAPATNATALDGEQSVRAAVTAATSATSKTLRLTATFASSASFVTATKNVANLGLFASSATGAGTLFAGNTFASSSAATNQAVNATYDLVWSTA